MYTCYLKYYLHRQDEDPLHTFQVFLPLLSNSFLSQPELGPCLTIIKIQYRKFYWLLCCHFLIWGMLTKTQFVCYKECMLCIHSHTRTMLAMNPVSWALLYKRLLLSYHLVLCFRWKETAIWLSQQSQDNIKSPAHWYISCHYFRIMMPSLRQMLHLITTSIRRWKYLKKGLSKYLSSHHKVKTSTINCVKKQTSNYKKHDHCSLPFQQHCHRFCLFVFTTSSFFKWL